MPARDGTGPDGKGPKTGRGLGPCGPDEPVKTGDGSRGRRPQRQRRRGRW